MTDRFCGAACGEREMTPRELIDGLRSRMNALSADSSTGLRRLTSNITGARRLHRRASVLMALLGLLRRRRNREHSPH